LLCPTTIWQSLDKNFLSPPATPIGPPENFYYGWIGKTLAKSYLFLNFLFQPNLTKNKEMRANMKNLHHL
jgi:hypothetical protein